MIGLTQYRPVLRIIIVFFQDPEKTYSFIARSIIDVALSLKSEENKISISMAPRNDNLNNKANELKSKEYADRYTLHDNSIHSQINKIKYKYRKLCIKFLSEYYLCIIIIQKKIHNFQTKKSRRT